MFIELSGIAQELRPFRMVYLATPYSKFPGGIDAGFRSACEVAGKLLRHGVTVYSPIAHTHPIAIHGDIDPLDHLIWLPFDEAMMDVCDAICVAKLPSWESSSGVAYEIEWFQSRSKPVFFLECGA